MDSIVKIFVAGSKDLKEERRIYRSVCNSLQNKWGTINTVTYEDFPEEVSKEGHQNSYNTFIEHSADLVVFIFSKKVGDITMSEFEHAYEAFKKREYPKIIPYININENSEEISKLKKYFSDLGIYYQEYSDLEDLEKKMKLYLSGFMKSHREKNILYKLKKILFCFGLWFVLSFLGGIGMYIYDQNMSENDCISLATEYIEKIGNNELLYRFPDKTYIYDMKNKSLKTIEYKKSMSSFDITLTETKQASIEASASLLFLRLFNGNKVKVGRNYKTILGYVALATSGVLGIGVGCIVEQMFFPPEYSKPMKEYLSKPSNWEIIITRHKASSKNWF